MLAGKINFKASMGFEPTTFAGLIGNKTVLQCPPNGSVDTVVINKLDSHCMGIQFY